jgi:type VI secretion system protein
MRGLRLLERLNARLDDTREHSREEHVRQVINSITEHLQRLLNTRRGSVPIENLYGVPDFAKLPGGMTNPDTKLLAQEIKETIIRFERRLRKPSVSFGALNSINLSIPFRIQATTQEKHTSLAIDIHGALFADGRIDIEPPGG